MDGASAAKGIIWMLVSVLAAGIMTIGIRELSHEIDSRMIVLLRGWGPILLILPPALMYQPLRHQIRVTKPRIHLTRGILLAAATHFGFYAIATVPLATATVLFFLAPIMATVIAGVFQGEAVGAHRIGASIAGFAGAVVILRPGASAIDMGLVSAITSSACFALALSQSKKVTKADGALSGTLSASLITGIVTIPIAYPVWELPGSWFLWLVAVVAILGGLVRTFADLAAYQLADAGLLAPIAYLRLIVVAVAAYAIYHEVPDKATWIGAAIIIGASLYIARREAIRGKAKTVSVPEKLL